MSCNGCRVLRKGCSESCILRPCLQWIDGQEAQGHATVFVAKFFGRAGLMSFISSVPESQRPALFQSLLFEACGRTVNPVNGAVGLLWTGQWHVCQAAVETVLRGGTLRPMADDTSSLPALPEMEEAEESCTTGRLGRSRVLAGGGLKRKAASNELAKPPALLPLQQAELDLRLTAPGLGEKRRASSPSEGSVTTSAESSHRAERRLLNLFI